MKWSTYVVSTFWYPAVEFHGFSPQRFVFVGLNLRKAKWLTGSCCPTPKNNVPKKTPNQSEMLSLKQTAKTPQNQWLVQMIHCFWGQKGPIFKGKLCCFQQESIGGVVGFGFGTVVVACGHEGHLGHCRVVVSAASVSEFPGSQDSVAGEGASCTASISKTLWQSGAPNFF